MKRLAGFVRFILLSAGFIFAVLLALTAIYGDNVAGLVIQEINSRSEVKTTLNDARLSLLRRFPRASVILSDVAVRGPVEVTGNDTIVRASSITLEFKISNILRKNYTVEWLSISGGAVNIFTDSSGISNIPQARKKEGREAPANLNIDLRNIRVDNILLSTLNKPKNHSSSVLLKSARLSGKMASNDIVLRADGAFEINTLSVNGINVRDTVGGRISLDFHKSADTMELKSGTLSLETMKFQVSGFYSFGNDFVAVSVSSENSPVRELSGFLPENQQKWLSYRPSGSVSAVAKADGIISRNTPLNYEIIFSLNNISLEIPGTSVRLRESYISGHFSNGKDNNAASSELSIDKLELRTPKSMVTGSLRYSDFLNPVITSTLNADIDLSEAARLSPALFRAGLTGNAQAALSFSGPYQAGVSQILKSVALLEPRGNIWLSSAGATLKSYTLSDITGNLMIAGNLWADSLSMAINGEHLMWSGEIGDFNRWITGDAGVVVLKGSLAMPSFPARIIFPDSTSARATADSVREYTFPPGYIADISFTAGELSHRNFTASDVTGRLRYDARRITIENIDMRTLGGGISGSVSVAEKPSGGFAAETSFSLNGIDINGAFKAFNNFGQNFIREENLKGVLAGSCQMRMNLASNLKPDVNTLSSEGKFVIDNGGLISFAPIMGMSRFIEISELENINFSRLENEFFINNGVFAIPQMEIKSSAADLGVSGQYYFSGDYRFHLRVLLSQILSGKAPRKEPNNEFGIVVDDGLGRTSLYLIVSRTGNKEQVAYDTRAVRSEVRENLQKEKQSLKGILKEELGWYGKDTTIAPPTEQKPRFRIIWDEGIQPDSATADTTARHQKGGTIRSLFNKIKKGPPGEHLP